MSRRIGLVIPLLAAMLPLGGYGQGTESLGGAVQVEGYEIRPPKDQPQNEMKGPPGSKLYAWGGNLRPDKTAPSFLMGLSTPPADQAAKVTAEDFLKLMLK